jgi:protein-S-isoprenylcysteine O-methyltransferase Ste14
MTNLSFATTDNTSPQGFVPWIRNVVTEKRIRISVIVITLLIIEDVVVGIKPHDIFNFSDPETLLGLSLITFGLGLRSWAAGVLRKRKTLTTTGPYSLIRNPLYAGSFSMMFGFCAIIDDMENIWILLALIVFVYLAQTRYEENCLAKKFSGDWDKYAERTPRFIPRTLKSNWFADWKLSNWFINREYQAVITTLFALAGLKLWQAL